MKEEKYVYWVNYRDLNKVIYPKRIKSDEEYGEFFMNYIVNSKKEAVVRMYKQLKSHETYHVNYDEAQTILKELRIRTLDEFPEMWI